MRVALFTLELPPAYSGGLGVHVGGLVDYLRGEGDIVDVFYLGRPPAPVVTIPLPGVDVRLPGGVIDLEQVPGAGTVLARHAADPYDVIHCHDWHGVLPAAALWSRGVPMVTTCHLPAAARFHYPGQRGSEPGVLLEALALRLSHRVIAVSHFVAREIERSYRAFADKVRVVPNGTDAAMFAGEAGGASKPLVLAVGRLTSQKGFFDLLEIFDSVRSKLPPARLRIVGSGPDETALRKAMSDRGGADGTELLPFTERHTLRAHYRQARVLAVTSVYEPFGLVAIEAMACSVPVVAYATGGLPEIITDGVDGRLVAPNDREGFAAALIRLLGDPGYAEGLGRRARETAAARFRDEVSYARTRALYRV